MVACQVELETGVCAVGENCDTRVCRADLKLGTDTSDELELLGEMWSPDTAWGVENEENISWDTPASYRKKKREIVIDVCIKGLNTFVQIQKWTH